MDWTYGGVLVPLAFGPVKTNFFFTLCCCQLFNSVQFEKRLNHNEASIQEKIHV